MRYLINVTYDGNYFFGYQKQKDQITVQGEIEKVLSIIFNKEIKIISASRTDAGVHAYNQYAHFDIDKEIDVCKIKKSINKMINNSIFVKSIKKVHDDFHARYDVKLKEYVYKINTGDYNPIEKNYYYQYNKSINVSLMKKAIKCIKGTHNFKSFTSDTTKINYERTIKNIIIKKQDNYIYIYIIATGFLKYMVRNIVGLLLEINEGKKNIEDIDKIFKSQDRTKNAKTINPEGLYLNKIWYKEII